LSFLKTSAMLGWADGALVGYLAFWDRDGSEHSCKTKAKVRPAWLRPDRRRTVNAAVAERMLWGRALRV